MSGRTTQGNYTRGCEERRCSAGSLPRDPRSETSQRFSYRQGNARRRHAPVWATIAEHQHPVSKQPRGTANPEADSALSEQRYPPPETHPCEGLPSPARGKRVKAQALRKRSPLDPSGLFQVFSVKAPAGTLPAAMRFLPAPGTRGSAAFAKCHRQSWLGEVQGLGLAQKQKSPIIKPSRYPWPQHFSIFC